MKVTTLVDSKDQEQPQLHRGDKDQIHNNQ